MNKPNKIIPGSLVLRQKSEHLAEKKQLAETKPLTLAGIEKLLHELEIHKIELELQKAELEMALDQTATERVLYDFASAGYFALSPEGTICQLNHYGAKLLGGECSDLVSINFRHFVETEMLTVFNGFLKEIFETGSKQSCEIKLNSGENHTSFVYLEGLKSGDVQKCFITAVDFSDRKLSEETLKRSEEKFNMAFYNSPDSITITRASDGKLVEVNDGFERISGYTRNEAIGHSTIDLNMWVNKHDRDRYVSMLKENGRVTDLETNFRAKSGEIHNFVLSGEIYEMDGENFILGIIRDLSGYKRAEAAIKLNEARLESLIRLNEHPAETIKGFMDFALKEAIILTGSKTGYICFYDEIRQEFTLNSWSKGEMEECMVLLPETVYRLETIGLWGEAVRQRQPIMINDFTRYNVFKKGIADGHIKLDKFLTIPVFSEDRIVAAIGVANKQDDYTDADIRQLTLMMDAVWKIVQRKQMMEALLESKEQLRTTLNSIGDGVITADTEGIVRQMNPVAEQLTGWSEAEAAGRTLEEVFPIINEETRASIEIPVRKVLRDGVMVGLANHTMLIAKNGTERAIADSGAPIRNNEGEIIGVVLVFRDQTEERKAESALRESEKRFKLLYENAPLSYQSLDTNTRLIDVNPTWLTTMGYTRAEVIGRLFGDFMTPESAYLIKERFPRFVAEGEIHDYQFEMVRKDGKHFLVSYDGKIGYNEMGNFIQTHCIFSDITERTRTEKQLKESEANLNSLINNRNESIWSIDRNYNYIILNNFFIEAYRSAYNLELKVGMNALSILTPGMIEFWKPEYDRALSGERVVFEFSDQVRQALHVYQVTLNPIISDSKVTGVSALSLDVTERKRAEQNLIESEKRLAFAMEGANEGLWDVNLKTNEVFLSPRGCEILGYGPEELDQIAKVWRDIVYPEDLPVTTERLSSHLEGHSVIFSVEQRLKMKSGILKWVLTRGKIVERDENGNALRMVGTHTDISEQKRATDKLLESEEAYRHISAAVSDYVFSSDINKEGILTLQWVAGAFEKISGYNYEEYIACGGWRARLHPDDLETDKRDIEKLRSNQRIDSEIRTIKKDGSVLWVRVYANPVMNSEGTELIGIKGAVQDINERKLAEEEFLKLKNELEVKVEEKTKELKERVTELERFYDATIDRELRIKELHDEIELLKMSK